MARGPGAKKEDSSTWLVWINLTVPRKEITLKMIIVNHRSLPRSLSSYHGVNYLAHLDLIYIFSSFTDPTIDNPCFTVKVTDTCELGDFIKRAASAREFRNCHLVNPFFSRCCICPHHIRGGETKPAPSGAFLETFKEIKDAGIGVRTSIRFNLCEISW